MPAARTIPSLWREGVAAGHPDPANGLLAFADLDELPRVRPTLLPGVPRGARRLVVDPLRVGRRVSELRQTRRPK